MSELKNEDNRQFTRVEFVTEVDIQQVEAVGGDAFVVKETTVLGKALDISEGGMRLELTDAAELGEILKLNFFLEKNNPLEVYTKQVWKNGNIYGLKFIPATEGEGKHVHFYLTKNTVI